MRIRNPHSIRQEKEKRSSSNTKSAVLRLGSYVITFILIILSLFYLWTLYRGVVGPQLSCTVCDTKLDILKKKEDIESTLYIIKSPVDNRLAGAWLVISNSNLAKTLVIYVPPGVFVGDPNELFRSYIQVSDLEYAGVVINPERAVEYVVWQLESMTGFTVENYIWVDESSLIKLNELFGDISEYSHSEYSNVYSNPTSISNPSLMVTSFIDKFMFTKIATNPTLWADTYRSLDTNLSSVNLISHIYTMKGRFKAMEVEMIDLSQEEVILTTKDLNEKEISVINYSAYDRIIEENFNIVRSRSVEKEQAKVEVYNGSGISGLASRYARKVQNFGIKVVRYDNAPQEYERTTIYVSNRDKFGNSFESVQDLICRSCDIIEGRPDFITTGDIIVILGRDKEEELRWK
ncbi:LytR C-terminal domain-containing protein [Candidatus Dojkabacteria bacterium]|nr:LytR C-terminal domain-containing protein [Candidatus Dojkabacteria bacterium]